MFNVQCVRGVSVTVTVTCLSVNVTTRLDAVTARTTHTVFTASTVMTTTTAIHGQPPLSLQTVWLHRVAMT